jgi:hypothetical protein
VVVERKGAPTGKVGAPSSRKPHGCGTLVALGSLWSDRWSDPVVE